MTELEALLHGLEIAANYHFTDSVEILHLLQHPLPRYTDIIHNCRLLLRNVGNPVVQHNFREANAVADVLSRKGEHLHSPTKCVLTSPPAELEDLLQQDNTGVLCRRLVSWSLYNTLLSLGNPSVFATASNSTLVSVNATRSTAFVTSTPRTSTSTLCTDI
ncbi:hypothetical protein FXO37_07859 [Capsicum annuum]|nr:hypothetical protein FXO37_07859 [Capsicum annuum]